MTYLHTERKNQMIALSSQFLATIPMPAWGYNEEQIDSAINSAKQLISKVDKVLK